jgi:hypothetical protein
MRCMDDAMEFQMFSVFRANSVPKLTIDANVLNASFAKWFLQI